MKLANRFSEEDKIRYWIDHMYCSLCKSNQNCSLHHIEGCKQDYHRSIYNSIMLCYECHTKADGHNTDSPLSKEFRKKLLEYTRWRVEGIGKDKNTYDVRFLRSLKEQWITNVAKLPMISIIVGMAITIKQKACLKCNYEWFPRSTGMPKICPRCKSHKWNDKKK